MPTDFLMEMMEMEKSFVSDKEQYFVEDSIYEFGQNTIFRNGLLLGKIKAKETKRWFKDGKRI
jgi:hypothetical protein